MNRLIYKGRGLRSAATDKTFEVVSALRSLVEKYGCLTICRYLYGRVHCICAHCAFNTLNRHRVIYIEYHTSAGGHVHENCISKPLSRFSGRSERNRYTSILCKISSAAPLKTSTTFPSSGVGAGITIDHTRKRHTEIG